MGILDYPIGAGNADDVETLIQSITSELTAGPGSIVLGIGQTSEETAWLVNRIAQRGALIFSPTCTLNRADPFTSVNRFLDFENSTGLYSLNSNSLLLIEGLHCLSLDNQRSFLGTVNQACQSTGSRALVTCEYARTAFTESTDAVRVVPFPMFPADPAPRALIVRELLDRALSRERLRISPREAEKAAAEISALDLPRGFWQADRVAAVFAKTAATTGAADVSAAIAYAHSRSTPSRTDSIAADTIRASLARLDAYVGMLNTASVEIDRKAAFTLGHLPPNTDFCSLPQHWFDATVARWYAFCFDGGHRLTFLNRLQVHPGNRLVHVARAESQIPLLLQAFRTWQAHGLDPAAYRTQKQRSLIDQWLSRACGTARPRDFQWRGLAVILTREIEKYLAQLVAVTQLLKRYPDLVVAMHEFIESETARRMR